MERKERIKLLARVITPIIYTDRDEDDNTVMILEDLVRYLQSWSQDIIFNNHLRRGRIYISGAIAHHDLEERMETFAKAEAELRKEGYLPFNPFKNGVPQDAPWREHMRADLAHLLQCDHIYMLEGWELSKGAKLELDVASSCGIKVLFQSHE